jgi:DNA-nicking Smr family endonuclease
MSKTPKPPGRRHLSTEDETLWEHMTSSLDPLKKKKSRHHAAVPDPEDVAPFLSKSTANKGAAKKAGSERTETKVPAAASARSKAPPALNTFDRKAARKLRQGQFEIEARIDLHGMRQQEAHAALRRFLFSSFAKGRRWVLVITGKGATLRQRDDEAPYIGASERGVLRRNVPMWLAEPELRAIVVSFTNAAIPHGGDGALYVQLRNPDKAR